MKNNLTELITYDIVTMDGSKAKIKDLLFDEQTWIIRYIEADFGSISLSQRIFLPRILFREINSEMKEFHVDLTMETISNCPKAENDGRLSRMYEEQLNKYYGTPFYWLNSVVSYYYAPDVTAERNNHKSHLRSFNEVKGFCICSIDHKIGWIDDMIIDSSSWHISYLVIETAGWLPLSKRIAVSIYKVENISYANKEANISLTTEIIKNAPAYDSLRCMDENYERSLHDYYEGSPV